VFFGTQVDRLEDQKMTALDTSFVSMPNERLSRIFPQYNDEYEN
jgi:hypothetical protein